MRATGVRSLVLIAAALLAGCGGGASALPRTLAPNGVPSSLATGPAAAFAFTAAPSSAVRSVTVALDAGPNQVTASLNVAPGSPGCTAPVTAAPATCSVSLAAAPGDHTFGVTAYGGALDRNGKPQGTVLSRNAGIPLAVARSALSSVAIALDGTPAALAVMPSARQDVQGTQQSGFDVYGVYRADGTTPFDRTFTVLATDANGSYVLGPNAPAVTLTSSDPGTLSNGNAAGNDPNAFTVSGMSYGATSLELAATATPPAGSNLAPLRARVAVRIAARNAPRVYVMDHLTRNVGKVWVFDEEGNQIATSGTFGGLNGGLGIGYDKRLSRLYVTNEYGNSIAAYDLDGNAIATPGTFPNLYFPLGLYVDAAHGLIYAGNFNGGIDNQNDGSAGTGPCSVPRAAACGVTVYDEQGNQVAVTGSWREREGVAPYLPYGVLADASSGRVYVTDAGYNRAEAYDATGRALFSWPTGAGAHGIAQDAASKDVYVADDAACVSRYGPLGEQRALPAGNCTSRDLAAPDANAFQNVRGPIAVRQNPATGWLYVANYANNSVTAYDRDGNQIALRGANLNGGPFGFNGSSGVVNGPIGIEVVP